MSSDTAAHPERQEFKHEYVRRAMADVGMSLRYPNEYQRRHAIEQLWSGRLGARAVRSRYAKTLYRHREQRQRHADSPGATGATG